MIKRVVILAALFLFSLCPGVFADTAIKAEVDKTRISADDTVTFKVIITSTNEKLPQPEIPAFEDFSVLSTAQSSSFALVKGGVKTHLTYVFILMPKRDGVLNIPPATITVKEGKFSSEAFAIEVSPGAKKSLPRKKGNSQKLPGNGSGAPQITL